MNNIMESKYVEYCLELVAGLCSNEPENIKVTKSVDEMGVLLTVSGISQSDMPNVIGREGAHAKAIRMLVRVAGAKENARISMKIDEPSKEI